MRVSRYDKKKPSPSNRTRRVRNGHRVPGLLTIDGMSRISNILRLRDSLYRFSQGQGNWLRHRQWVTERKRGIQRKVAISAIRRLGQTAWGKLKRIGALLGNVAENVSEWTVVSKDTNCVSRSIFLRGMLPPMWCERGRRRQRLLLKRLRENWFYDSPQVACSLYWRTRRTCC